MSRQWILPRKAWDVGNSFYGRMRPQPMLQYPQPHRPNPPGDAVKTIQELRTQLAAGAIDPSAHASEQMEDRHIDWIHIQEAGANAEILEEYPYDKYSPSCLLLGFTADGQPLHILVSVEEDPLVRIITAYRPDPARWRNHRERIR